MKNIKIRSIFIILILLMLTFLATACSNTGEPIKLEMMESQAEDNLLTKSINYDSFVDKKYIDMLKKFTNMGDINPGHVAIGNLSNNPTPEIVFFREKNPDNIDDQGYLEVYGFNGENYSLVDRVSMNFDNTNYQLVVGKISEKTNGIYLNNQAGAHSGVTYGFILKNDKLVNILNPKKINLLSSNTDNEIRDIDQDGILEFSISTTDPEVLDKDSTNAQYIKLWYRWDGDDSALLVDLERDFLEGNSDSQISNEEIYNEVVDLIRADDSSFISYLKEKQGKLSKIENTRLIKRYVSKLQSNLSKEEKKINILISEYKFGNSIDKIKDKYELPLELINDPDYLKREKVLSSEEGLKNLMISNLYRGYKLAKTDEGYKIIINYKLLLDEFKDNILNEYKDYLRILSAYTGENIENITIDDLAERIVLIENFNMTYPYSLERDEVNSYHDEYISFFFREKGDSPTLQSNEVGSKSKLLKKYREIKEKYSHVYLSDLIAKYLSK